MKNETELLAAVRNGSLDDFGELVRRYQQRVFAILGRYERDYQRVEDLAQQTFIKAWKAFGGYDGRAPFENWISRIATRTALDHLRRRHRLDKEIHFSCLGESALEWLRSDNQSSSPEARQAREILDIAMRGLSPEDRLVITLLEIEMRSVKEISGLTGWSGITVRVRAHRARSKLRKILEQMIHERR